MTGARREAGTVRIHGGPGPGRVANEAPCSRPAARIYQTLALGPLLIRTRQILLGDMHKLHGTQSTLKKVFDAALALGFTREELAR